MAAEIDDVGRFPTTKRFASYKVWGRAATAGP